MNVVGVRISGCAIQKVEREYIEGVGMRHLPNETGEGTCNFWLLQPFVARSFLEGRKEVENGVLLG